MKFIIKCCLYFNKWNKYLKNICQWLCVNSILLSVRPGFHWIACVAEIFYGLVSIESQGFAECRRDRKFSLRHSHTPCDSMETRSSLQLIISYSIRKLGGVPVREDTCLGPSVLWGRVASSFPRRLYFPDVSTRPPFAARWTVSKRPTLSLECILNRVLRRSENAL